MKTCNICETELHSHYNDARIPGSGWVTLCDDCADYFNCKFGTGQGQRFELVNDNWIKTKG